MAIPERSRRSHTTWPLLVSLVLFSTCADLSAALARQAPIEVPKPLESTADLVAIDVTVLDRSGNFVGGLERNNFRILDNGVEKPPLYFAPVDTPARVAIVIETGPAVYLIHQEHLAALSALLNGLASDDQAALFGYAEAPRQIVPFTSDRSALLQSVNVTQYVVGMDALNFYDSLGAVVDLVRPGGAKQAIVVLSTGLDSGPEDHWNALEQRLRAANVVIFPVALGGSLRVDSPVQNKKKKTSQPPGRGAETPAFLRADKALRSLAEITGGKAYFPVEPGDFATAYREIAAAVRHQYVLGFAPDHDGSFHKLSVGIRDDSRWSAGRGRKSPQLRTLYREGYLAPAQ